MELDYNNPHAN